MTIWGSLAYNLGDSSGRETLCRVTGGMKVKADRDESSPYAAMLAAQDVAARCKELGINALHIRIRATGGKNLTVAYTLFDICGGSYSVRRERDQDSRSRCSIRSPRSCSLRHEDRSDRRCDSYAIRFDPSQRRSERSSSMSVHFLLAGMRWIQYLQDSRRVAINEGNGFVPGLHHVSNFAIQSWRWKGLVYPENQP